MKNTEDDLYDIDKYSDDELYDMLDMNNPSDRELEAKIMIMVNKYDEIEGSDAKKIKTFFERMHERFFDNDEEEEEDQTVIELGDDEYIEGFEGMDNVSDYKNEVTDKNEVDKGLLQTTPLFYGASKLNPLMKETQKRAIQLDSQFRNYNNYPHSTDYIINLSEQLHNVVSLRLHSISVPYTWYNVSNVYDANYFKLLGDAPGITGVYNLTFNIAAGTYNTPELMDAINASIAVVAGNNTDIEFGTTGVSHNIYTSKITFTLDIQQVYNETNYYILFNHYTSPFDSKKAIDAVTGLQQTQTVRQLSIPGFFGYGNLVIPRYTNTNIIQKPPDPLPFTPYPAAVEHIYSMESIYSKYDYCYSITGKKTLVSDPQGPIEYNYFDPNETFYLIINDTSNNVVGNNYFTIKTFDGPNPYDASAAILDTIVVEFGDVSGFYTRTTLLEAVNRSLTTDPNLSLNASLNQMDISYNEQDDTTSSIVTMQRFQLRTLLDRKTTTKKKDAKQIVLFPDEDAVFNSLPTILRNNWTGKIWTGQSSCFLFNDDNKFTQSNAVPSEIAHLQTLYKLTSNPTMTFRCIKDGGVGGKYDNSTNNRTIILDKSIDAGYTDGYTLMNYFGVYSYNVTGTESEKVYEYSQINSKFKKVSNDIPNGYVDVSAFYDAGSTLCRIQVDMNTYFNETMYTFDLSASFLNDRDAAGATIGLNGFKIGPATTDVSYGVITGLNGPGDVSGACTTTTLNIPTGLNILTGLNGNVIGENQPYNVIYSNPTTFDVTFPFEVGGGNNKIVVDVSGTVLGLAGVGTAWVTGYPIYIPEKKYAQPYLLVNAINNTFAKIQGDTDPSGNKLYGLNMSQSRFYMSDVDGSTKYKWALKLVVTNNISQNDYILEFADAKSDYVNPWIDTNGNNRYSLNSSGELVTSTAASFTGTSWNAFLGFTETSYSLIPPSAGSGSNREGSEVLSTRDIMNDISGSIFIYENDIADAEGTVSYSKNNMLSFLPQTNVKGLYDENGINRIEINIDGGIYSYYNLLNALNNQLQLNNETAGSIVYNYFSLEDESEKTVFQMNINKIYTAQDYKLEFYSETESAMSSKIRNITSSNSYQSITWDVTLGWMLGFRSFPVINLNSTDASNSRYVETQSYSLDADTGIITLIGDTGVDLFLYKTLYLIIDDFTQNHLNDGLITGVRDNPLANKPSYSSKATKVCNPITKREQTSIFSASQPGMGLTENQLYAANVIAEENFTSQTTRLYSDPPYVKDMFAVIPIKVSSLKQGELFTEYGGTLQDNDRKYFGPVDISKLNIKLLNDHGDVIDLNGNNWSFTLLFEYLYNLKGI